MSTGWLLLEYFASSVTPIPEEAASVVVISDAPPVLSSASRIKIGPREEKAALPVPMRKTGFNKEKRIVVLFVVVLLLEFSFGPSIFGEVQRAVQNTSDAAVTAGNRTYDAVVTAQAEGQAQANATAEAVANASPVAYPPHNLSPALDDPLQNNSKGNNWESAYSGASTWGTCRFINRAIDINANLSESAWCIALRTDFTDFIYELQMKIVKGNGGGIAFRIDPATVSLLQSSSLENGSDGQFLHCACMRSNVFLGPFSQAKWNFSARSGGGFHPNEYEFVINQDGSYSVEAYTPDTNGAVLAQGFSPAIHRGLNQTNLVAAVVHGKIIELYVNHQRVAVVDSADSGTYTPLTHGLIGVIATDSTESNQTEVIVQNAKVWKL